MAVSRCSPPGPDILFYGFLWACLNTIFFFLSSSRSASAVVIATVVTTGQRILLARTCKRQLLTTDFTSSPRYCTTECVQYTFISIKKKGQTPIAHYSLGSNSRQSLIFIEKGIKEQ